MPTVAELTTILDADPRKLDAALARAEAALKRFEGIGGQVGAQAGAGLAKGLGAGADAAGQSLGGLTAKADQSANAALALARAQAQGAAQAGDYAGSASILSRALQGSTAGAVQQQGAMNQLASAQRRASGESKGLRDTLATLATEGVGLVGGLAGVAAALGVVGSAMIDTAERARQIQLNLGALDPAQLTAVSNATQLLANRFDADLNRQLDTSRVLMTAFGTTATGSFDIMAAGFANGLNVSDDFLDTLKEYAPSFAALGFSAEDTLSLIQRGLQNGARDTDYVGDAIKELNILLNETATVGKLEGLDAGLANIVQRFQEGQITGEEAFAAITQGLSQIENAAVRQAAGVALMGPQFENLGITAVVAMGQVDTALIGTAGAVDLASQRIQSLGEVLPLVLNAVGQSSQGLNTELLTLINGMLAMNAASAEGVGPMQAVNDAALASAGSYEEYRAALESNIAATQSFIENSSFLQAIFSAFPAVFADAANAAAGFVAGLLGMSEQEVNTAIAAREAAAAIAEQSGMANEATAAIDETSAATDYLAGATQNQTAATADNSAATQQGAQTAAEMALARLNQAAEAEKSEQAERILADAIREANQAGADVPGIVARVAQALGLEQAQVAATIRQWRGLHAARANVEGAAAGAIDALGKGVGGTGRSAGGGKGVDTSVLDQFRENIAREAAAATSSAGRGRGGGGKARGGGGGGAGGKSEAEKLAEQEAKAAEKAEEQRVAAAERLSERLIDLEEDRQQKILDIVEEYAEKRADAEESFADAQISSRADFYESLADIEDQGLRQQLAAAYEAAQIEAAALATEKGADVAEKFLAAQEKILARRAKRAEELAKLDAAAREGDKDAAADAEYLRGVEKLRQEEEQRTLDKIRRGEGSIAEDEAAETAEAEADFAEKQRELLGGASELSTVEQERLRILAEQTLEMQRQAALAGQIAGGVPSAASAPTAAPASGGGASAGPSSAAAPAGLAAGAGGAVEVASTSLSAELAGVRQSLDRLAQKVEATNRRSTLGGG